MSTLPPNNNEIPNPNNQPYQPPAQPQGFPQIPPHFQNQPNQNFQPAPPQPQQNFPAYQNQPQFGHRTRKTNILAVLSLAFSFPISIVAIILGHIALSQIKKTDDQGKGIAIAGLIIGYLVTLTTIIGIAILLILMGSGVDINGTNTAPTGPAYNVSSQTVPEGCKIFIAAVQNQTAAIQQTTTLAQTDPQTAAQQLITESDTITSDSTNVTNTQVRTSVDAVTSGLKAVANDVLNGTDPTNDNTTFQASLKTAESLCQVG